MEEERVDRVESEWRSEDVGGLSDREAVTDFGFFGRAAAALPLLDHPSSLLLIAGKGSSR